MRCRLSWNISRAKGLYWIIRVQWRIYASKRQLQSSIVVSSIYMVGVLIQRHIVVSDRDTICLSTDYRHTPAQELLESAVRQLPDDHGEFLLLRYCLEAYPREILSGKSNALRVLYPKGNNDLIHQYVRDHHPLADSIQLVGKQAVAQYVNRMKNRPLKILEIGAGAGIFTQQVLPLLVGFGRGILFHRYQQRVSRGCPGKVS